MNLLSRGLGHRRSCTNSAPNSRTAILFDVAKRPEGSCLRLEDKRIHHDEPHSGDDAAGCLLGVREFSALLGVDRRFGVVRRCTLIELIELTGFGAIPTREEVSSIRFC